MKTLHKTTNRRPCHKKLEALNRAYLHALGEVMQATAQMDKLTETFLAAEKQLQHRERKLTAADNAMAAYLNRFNP